MRILGALVLAALGAAVHAQDDPADRERTLPATGAVLRALDMMTGELQDIAIATGETRSFRRLEISLDACLYPAEHPLSDAFARLAIRDVREAAPRFRGWMVASSPALSALDHPRYDVWVLRCEIPDSEGSGGDG